MSPRTRRTRRSVGSHREVPLSCRSTTRRHHHPHLHHHTASSASSHSSSKGPPRDEAHSRVSKTTAIHDTEMLVVGRRQPSSHGSCTTWSMTSLLDKRPKSPSPICSPNNNPASPTSEVYYSQVSTGISSAPRIQSSSAFDRTKSASPGDVEKGRLEDNNAFESFETRTGSVPGSNQRFCTSKQLKMQSITEEKRRVKRKEKQMPIANCPLDCDGDRRFSTLPALEEEAIERGRTGHHQRRIHLSSDEESGFENSDIESVTDERPTLSTIPQYSESRRDGLGAKLLQWKESRTHSLMTKLKKKVEEIDRWEKKKITEAKTKVKELEDKLEKERDRAAQKMQSRVMVTHLKADKKRKEARASANSKMEKVVNAFDEIEKTGKLPWKLVFLCH